MGYTHFSGVDAALLKINGTQVTATAAEINALASTGLSATELGYLDGVTAGAVTASKAAVVDISKDIGDFRNLDAVNIDAGASGAAGTVDIFPATVTSGKLALTAADSAGDTTTTIVNASQAGARTYTIPDAGASTSFVMGAGDATVAGVKTFSSAPVLTAGVGAAAGTGVVAVETGFGNFKTTTLTLTNTPVVMADNAGVTAYGSLQIYDFPQGYIYMQSALSDLALTLSAAGINADWDGDIGLGTVAADNTATPLATTEQNIIPNTATPQAAASATTGDAVSTATEHAIHDGTSAAKEVYLNLLVDDADHDVTSTPTNIICNGTIVLNWLFMGDN